MMASPSHNIQGSIAQYAMNPMDSMNSVVGPGAASVGLQQHDSSFLSPVQQPQSIPHPGVLVPPLAPQYQSPPQHVPAPFPVYYHQQHHQPQQQHNLQPQQLYVQHPQMMQGPYMQSQQHHGGHMMVPQMPVQPSTPARGKSLQDFILSHHTPSSQSRPRASSTSSSSSASTKSDHSSPEESSPMSPVGTPLPLAKLFEAAALSPREKSKDSLPPVLDQLFAAAASPSQSKSKIGSTPTLYAGSNLPSAPDASALPDPSLMMDEEPGSSAHHAHEASQLLAALSNPKPAKSAKKPKKQATSSTKALNNGAKPSGQKPLNVVNNGNPKKTGTPGKKQNLVNIKQPVKKGLQTPSSSKKQQPQKVTILKRPKMGVGASAPARVANATNHAKAQKSQDATKALKKMLNMKA